MATHPPLIVVVEDHEQLNALVRDLLVEEGYHGLCCFSGVEAEPIIRQSIPDPALIDMQMEVPDAGFRLLKAL
jgi:CheY-like chemotaxis protein